MTQAETLIPGVQIAGDLHASYSLSCNECASAESISRATNQDKLRCSGNQIKIIAKPGEKAVHIKFLPSYSYATRSVSEVHRGNVRSRRHW